MFGCAQGEPCNFFKLSRMKKKALKNAARQSSKRMRTDAGKNVRVSNLQDRNQVDDQALRILASIAPPEIDIDLYCTIVDGLKGYESRLQVEMAQALVSYHFDEIITLFDIYHIDRQLLWLYREIH